MKRDILLGMPFVALSTSCTDTDGRAPAVLVSCEGEVTAPSRRSCNAVGRMDLSRDDDEQIIYSQEIPQKTLT
jgi:hypothetical protein